MTLLRVLEALRGGGSGRLRLNSRSDSLSLRHKWNDYWRDDGDPLEAPPGFKLFNMM